MINGLCSNCGVLRDLAANTPALEPRYSRGATLADDLETIVPYALWLAPSVVMVVLGLALSIEWLLFAGVALLVLPPLARLVFATWW